MMEHNPFFSCFISEETHHFALRTYPYKILIKSLAQQGLDRRPSDPHQGVGSLVTTQIKKIHFFHFFFPEERSCRIASATNPATISGESIASTITNRPGSARAYAR